MKEYICEDEGISVNVTETEDVCPNCKGTIIDIDAISVSDWRWILENQISNLEDYPMKDIEDYLDVIKAIKRLNKKK